MDFEIKHVYCGQLTLSGYISAVQENCTPKQLKNTVSNSTSTWHYEHHISQVSINLCVPKQ